MAQTTYGVPMACGYVGISVDCATYTDISGYAQTVTPAEQTRITGEAYTFSGDASIFFAGKRTPVSVVVNIVYTEDDAGAFDIIEAIHDAVDCPAVICLRWMPRGDVAGYQQYTLEGSLTGFQYPPMDASAGGPIMVTFTVMGAQIDPSVKAS